MWRRTFKVKKQRKLPPQTPIRSETQSGQQLHQENPVTERKLTQDERLAIICDILITAHERIYGPCVLTGAESSEEKLPDE